MIRRNYCNSYLEVSFENETNIEAIISLLLRGRFLNKLKFTNINVEKQVLDNPSRSLADYQLPFLTELKFYGSPCLTSDDYSLLHWINKRVTIPHLQSFAFIGDIRFADRSCKAKNKIKDTDSSILEDFLIAHRSSLKCLSLAGVFLKNIGNHVSHELHITTAASNVSRHLRSLSTSLDNPGMDLLLNGTRNLERLMWNKHQYFDEIVAENFSALLNCIQSNWRCLRSIEITPVIVSKEISDELLQTLTIDCEVFEDCYNLQVLKIRQNFTTDVDNYQLAVPGRVRNIHLLPASLQSLEIWADRYEQTDLDLFAMRFEKFRSLHTFYLTCPTDNSYVVPKSWVKAIQKMQNINVAIFIGGALKNIDDVRRCLKYNSRSRTRLTMADDNRIILQRK